MYKHNGGYIAFTKEEMEDIIFELQGYFSESLEMELSAMQARLMLHFITNKLGAYYYNEGVKDSIAFISEKTDDLYALIRP